MCEKDFLTAEGSKCVTTLQELIPSTRALCRHMLGVWLHSGADSGGEQPPATAHVALLFAVEWQVRRKRPVYLVNQAMGRDVFCSLPGHCSTASISLPISHVWKPALSTENKTSNLKIWVNLVQELMEMNGKAPNGTVSILAGG